MEYAIQTIIERTIRFRKQLHELEKKRSQLGSDVPPDLWSDLIKISRALDKEERKAQAAGRVKSARVNELRTKIVKVLDQYNAWRAQMRESEQLFLTNIVNPGNRLAQAVSQRQYLEQEYRRIRTAIESENYVDLEELEFDIRKILTHSDTAFDLSEENIKDKDRQEKAQEMISTEIDFGETVDELDKDKLVREFRRIVLPAIHPDTSDTDEQVFIGVLDVFENRDYDLMEAYIVQYGEEIEPDVEGDPLENLESLDAQQTRYENLSERMNKRISGLKHELTTEELEDRDKLRLKLREQGNQIRKETQLEGEKILQLRDKIEGLVQLYLDRQS